MAFPATWPPRRPSGTKSLRFYVTDTATANPHVPLPNVVAGSSAAVDVSNEAGTGLASPSSTGAAGPLAQIWSGNIRISVATADLEFSFDGVTVQGKVLAGESVIYRQRFESGIAVRGAGAVYRIEAW